MCFVRRKWSKVSALLACVVLVATGCASHAGPRPRALAASSRSAMLTSHVITAAELANAHGSTAYDVVRDLRPLYLRGRGPVDAPMVAMDFILIGPVDELRRISVYEVAEIRYIGGAVATTQYGTGHTGGVIVVLTKNGRR